MFFKSFTKDCDILASSRILVINGQDLKDNVKNGDSGDFWVGLWVEFYFNEFVLIAMFDYNVCFNIRL